MVRKLISLLMAALIGGAAFADNIPAYAQAGPGPPPAGSGTGTVTSVACPNATITSAGSCTPLAASGTTGNVVTVSGANVADSGTALTALLTTAAAASTYAPLVSPALTGTPTAPTATAGTNTTQIATTAFVLANGGGQSSTPTRQSGNWYMPYFNAAMTTGAAQTTGRMQFMPFVAIAAITTSHLGARINTLSASGNIQLAIYANSNSCTGASTITSCPTGAALCSTGNLSTNAAGLVSAAATCTLSAGTLYWMGVNSDNSTATCQTVNGNASIATYLVGSATQSTLSSASGTSTVSLFAAQTFGTWPTVTSTSWSESNTNGTCMIEMQSA